MPVVKSLEGGFIPLAGSFDGVGFVELGAQSVLQVGQVAFSGRTP